MNEEKKSPAQRLKELEDRQFAKEQAIAAEREEQYATDREAIDALSEKLGVKVHYSKQVRQFVRGVPVIVGVRAPDAAEYKRLFSKMNRTNSNGDAKVAAHTELAQSCWVYPADGPTREAMLEANSGLLASVGNFANKLAEVEISEEGKD